MFCKKPRNSKVRLTINNGVLMEGLFYDAGLLKCAIPAEGVFDLDEERQTATFHCIARNVSANIHPILWNVSAPQRGKKAWEKISQVYGKENVSGKMQLFQTIFRSQATDFTSVEEYVNHITKAQERLVTQKAGLSDEVVAYAMLLGLPDEYRSLKLALDNSQGALSTDLVREKVLSCGFICDDRNSAMLLKQKPNPNSSASSSSPGGQKVTCYFCKKAGHKKPECRKYKQWLANQGNGSSQNKKQSTNNKQPPPKQPPKAQSNLVIADQVSESAVFMVKCEPDVAHLVKTRRKFYVDSGATKHVVKDRSLFSNLQTCDQTISVANGLTECVEGIGTINLSPKGSVSLSNTLLVPGLSVNLLSVSAICDKGYEVIFNKAGCAVTDDNGRVLLKGQREGGLFAVTTVEELDFAMTVSDSKSLWHRRLGHLGSTQMKQVLPECVEVNVSNSKLDPCHACCKGKMAKKPFHISNTPKSDELLGLVHADLMGPMNVESFGGRRYVMLIVDDCSRKIFCFLLRYKSEAFSVFKQFKLTQENQTGKKLRKLRTDNGTEFCNNEFQSFLREAGVIHQTTVPYNPEQNGVAERGNRTILEMCKCMLFDSMMDTRYWGHAVHCSVFVRNRCPSSAIDGRIPEEVWSARSVGDDVKRRVFGCQAEIYIPKEKRAKLESKSEMVTFVGYCEETKAYIFLDPANHSRGLIKARDATFFEDERVPAPENCREELHETEFIILEATIPQPAQPVQPEQPEINAEEDQDQVIIPNQPLVPERRASARQKKSTRDPMFVYNVITESAGDPVSVRDALSRSDADLWRKAMEEELASHASNNTWTLVSRPPNKNVVSSKWVFKIKRDASGAVAKYKARLVARGFNQIQGVDYQDTFSPTVSHSAIRALIATGVKHDWFIDQLDVKTAFLNGILEEEIYLEQPENFVEDPGMVCKLNRALYGLKQAARAWFLTLDPVLIKLGFKKSTVEPCVYYRTEGDGLAILTAYIDDILLFYSSAALGSKIKKELSEAWEITDLGPLSSYLGIRITRDMEAGTLVLDQEIYTREVLSRFNMDDCNPVSTPLCHSSLLERAEESHDSDKLPYQRLVGSLMYLSVWTRPDITHAVSVLSQFNSSYDNSHWQAAKRVLRYLKGTINYGLKFNKNETLFSAYTDANWGSCSMDRRSFSGHLILMSGSAVSWGSHKQRTVALSSTESEYVAASEAAKEAVFIKNLLEEVCGIQLPVTMFCDNKAVVHILRYEGNNSKKLRHVDMRYHFIRQLVEEKVLTLRHVFLL